jgi:hypothetical protein
MATQTRPQCPNCGSYKVWRRGKAWLWGGIVFAALSVPWVFALIGIPFLIAGLILALAGYGEVSNGNPLRCRACDWVE